MTMYEQSQQSDWLQTELESMSLQAASPAKTSQSQETSEALKQSVVDYGQSAPVFLGSFDPNTPSLKTSQTCLMENGELGLSEFSGTFPRSGMMRSGTVYQLPNLARTITEIGSGLWSTPLANDNITASVEAGLKEAKSGRNNLVAQVSKTMWPTPVASDMGSASSKRIEQAGHPKAALREAVFWPTPNASQGGTTGDWKPVRASGHTVQLSLAQSVRNLPTQQGKPFGGLNPTWVEWLMGFPLGHTDLNA
jgi:hypothetical protein